MDSKEYVTRGEFRDFEQRTDARLNSLQKEMHEGFLRVDDRFQHLTERMDDEFEKAATDAAKQQKEDHKFLLGTVISVVGVAVAILTLVVTFMK